MVRHLSENHCEGLAIDSGNDGNHGVIAAMNGNILSGNKIPFLCCCVFSAFSLYPLGYFHVWSFLRLNCLFSFLIT